MSRHLRRIDVIEVIAEDTSTPGAPICARCRRWLLSEHGCCTGPRSGLASDNPVSHPGASIASRGCQGLAMRGLVGRIIRLCPRRRTSRSAICGGHPPAHRHRPIGWGPCGTASARGGRIYRLHAARREYRHLWVPRQVVSDEAEVETADRWSAGTGGGLCARPAQHLYANAVQFLAMIRIPLLRRFPFRSTGWPAGASSPRALDRRTERGAPPSRDHLHDVPPAVC